MKLKTENYKGVAIQVVKNVLGNSTNSANEVLARFRLSGNVYTYKGDTKETAVARAKQALDKLL